MKNLCALIALAPADDEAFQLGNLFPAANDGVMSVRPDGDPHDIWDCELLDEGDVINASQKNSVPQLVGPQKPTQSKTTGLRIGTSR